ncbi:MAG TPA: tetratricopeptide repeat protein [Dehalococcoidia bacterium]|jgi:tetratricopeptide (TPR) repeat protein
MRLRLAVLTLMLSGLMLGLAATRVVRSDGDAQPLPGTSKREATASRIAQLEQAVRDRPDDVRVLTDLASLYLTRSRETGDPSYYKLADIASQRALAQQPDDISALVVAGTAALSKHDFAGALAIGERARDIDPDVTAVYGIITDAQIEMGQYDAAFASAQEMLDRHPNFASYSRASYLRELTGDVDGAIEAMQMAADAGTGLPYDEAWARVIVGNLYLTKGDVDAAERSYQRAEHVLPDDAMTDAALARIALARGDAASAEALLRSAVEQRPLPEYAIALGDLLASQGREAEADDQYALVRAAQQLFAANGVDTELELALFDADHGIDPAGTYERALAAYQRRGSLYAADTVAWAAYKAGRVDDAQTYMDLALRLGTRDPRLSYHAGVIALAAGDRTAARRHLDDAVSMQASQPVLYAVAAREALNTLTSEASR